MHLRYTILIAHLTCLTNIPLAATANSTAPSLVNKTANLEVWQQDQKRFLVTTETENLFHTVRKISYYHAQTPLGDLYYERWPLGINVIHSFWIAPAQRRHGYGLALLQFACQHLTQAGAQRILIQPGPFEKRDGKIVAFPPTEKAQRLAAIIRLYRQAGFQPAAKWLTYLARGLYPLMEIDENAHDLMVFNARIAS